jgi:polyhydroxyalkanoate synthesis regulator phasin|tara:strand:- start:29 stop:1150 length:1122 start_codon:yes stop_codon:yes gene_type:complete
MDKYIINAHDDLSTAKARKVLDEIAKTGRNEGGKGTRKPDSGGILEAVRIVLSDTRALLRAKLKTLTESISKLGEKLSDLNNRSLILEKDIFLRQSKVKPATGIIYTLVGVTYLVGDYVWTKISLNNMWGIGLTEEWQQHVLFISIGLATFTVKLFYERFIEVRFVEGSKVQDRVVKAFYGILLLGTIYSFLWIAYSQGVTSKITNSSLILQVDNIYDYIYEKHPFMNTISFIGVSFIFLTGGAVLLTVGMNLDTEYILFRKTKHNYKKLNHERETIETLVEHRLNELSEVKEQLENLNDDTLFENEVEIKTKFYENIYMREYRVGLKEYALDKEAAEKEYFSGDSFHRIVRTDLDLNSRKNGKIRRESHDQY